jgi:hypothetical protein
MLKIMEIRQNNNTYALNASMKDITAKMSGESKLMLYIAEQTRKDSRTVKLMTMVALVYLPASLVAVSNDRFRLGNGAEKERVDFQHGYCGIFD